MKYDKDLLERFVIESLSIADVCRKLEIRPIGGNYKSLKKYFNIYNIDISHFTGRAWNTGDKFRSFNKKYPIEDILVENSTYTNTHKLKKRLIDEGLKIYECEECGIENWNDKPISLHLDHKNGDNLDNRLENLRILCPNCHSQTSTYCKSTKKSSSSELRKSKYDKKSKNKYCICGKQIKKTSKMCNKCHSTSIRKVDRPSVEDLLKEIKEFGYKETGRRYGVSDNAIRKWIKST
jgi:hypothetical protein